MLMPCHDVLKMLRHDSYDVIDDIRAAMPAPLRLCRYAPFHIFTPAPWYLLTLLLMLPIRCRDDTLRQHYYAITPCFDWCAALLCCHAMLPRRRWWWYWYFSPLPLSLLITIWCIRCRFLIAVLISMPLSLFLHTFRLLPLRFSRSSFELSSLATMLRFRLSFSLFSFFFHFIFATIRVYVAMLMLIMIITLRHCWAAWLLIITIIATPSIHTRFRRCCCRDAADDTPDWYAIRFLRRWWCFAAFSSITFFLRFSSPLIRHATPLRFILIVFFRFRFLLLSMLLLITFISPRLMPCFSMAFSAGWLFNIYAAFFSSLMMIAWCRHAALMPFIDAMPLSLRCTQHTLLRHWAFFDFHAITLDDAAAALMFRCLMPFRIWYADTLAAYAPCWWCCLLMPRADYFWCRCFDVIYHATPLSCHHATLFVADHCCHFITNIIYYLRFSADVLPCAFTLLWYAAAAMPLCHITLWMLLLCLPYAVTRRWLSFICRCLLIRYAYFAITLPWLLFAVWLRVLRCWWWLFSFRWWYFDIAAFSWFSLLFIIYWCQHAAIAAFAFDDAAWLLAADYDAMLLSFLSPSHTWYCMATLRRHWLPASFFFSSSPSSSLDYFFAFFSPLRYTPLIISFFHCFRYFRRHCWFRYAVAAAIDADAAFWFYFRHEHVFADYLRCWCWLMLFRFHIFYANILIFWYFMPFSHFFLLYFFAFFHFSHFRRHYWYFLFAMLLFFLMSPDHLTTIWSISFWLFSDWCCFDVAADFSLFAAALLLRRLIYADYFLDALMILLILGYIIAREHMLLITISDYCHAVIFAVSAIADTPLHFTLLCRCRAMMMLSMLRFAFFHFRWFRCRLFFAWCYFMLMPLRFCCCRYWYLMMLPLFYYYYFRW